MTEAEVRRAELAPQRYGGLMLAGLFTLGAVSVALERGVTAAVQEIALALASLGWALHGWKKLSRP